MAGITNWVHPAVALLPPAGGSNAVSFRDEEMSGDADVQHQRELKFPEQSTPHALSLAEISGLAKPRAVPPAFVPPAQNGGYTKEQLKALRIGWRDSVCQSNEKRVKEYDRQLEEALEYEEEYLKQWRNRDDNADLVLARRSYEKGFATDNGKTQLAVSIPIEDPLQSLLAEARDDVVNCVLLLSGMHSRSEAADVEKSSTWIPEVAHIPQKDMHITVCIPSLWREPDTDPKAHAEYNSQVVKALEHVAADHEAFVLEVDRIMLAKDGSLLALFRTVGTSDSDKGLREPGVLSDRASAEMDPMTALRTDVLYVFLEKKLSHIQRKDELDLAAVHEHPKLLRQATIVRTVGGSAHGYVHCSLSRLALGPELTKKQLDLKHLHRICRSWTAKLAGRRMAVRGFILSEMTGLGEGGNKNPFDKARWLQGISLNNKEGFLVTQMSEQFRRETDDPRENPNFFLTQEDPDFWNNAARKPHMKALMQSDDHWKLRKNTWLQQFSEVQTTNQFRRELADRLDECTMATRRLVMPILHYRAVEAYLMQVVRQAQERGVPFPQFLEAPETQRMLFDFRNTIDAEGDKGADRIFQDWHQRGIKEDAAKQERRKIEGPKAVSSMKEVHDGLSFATKYRKDGVAEWERGNAEDALKAWRLGCEALERIRVPDTHASEQKFFSEVRVALLKNRALAALKLHGWQEALEAAEDVLKTDDQDHKAWFRKACALEGLGRLREVERCLKMIDTIAVGRPDRDRLERETSAKREKVQALLSRDEASQQRMLKLGLKKGLFSEERAAAPVSKKAQQALAPDVLGQTPALVNVDDATRKRLTHDGTEELLKELELVYSEPNFREQVRKLARDVNDQEEFVRYLNQVALPVQKPVLERWGFEATEIGVTEMRKAIQDHTVGDDAKLKRQAQATTRALYGEMYNAVRGKTDRERGAPTSASFVPEKERLKQAEKRLQRRLRGEDPNSDDDSKSKDDPSRLYAHWRSR
ncbi:alxA [Symbiodinium sp. CCMP2456]|nr:alxA [Symbiodinium sp. CCMP2456]